MSGKTTKKSKKSHAKTEDRKEYGLSTVIFNEEVVKDLIRKFKLLNKITYALSKAPKGGWVTIGEDPRVVKVTKDQLPSLHSAYKRELSELSHYHANANPRTGAKRVNVSKITKPLIDLLVTMVKAVSKKKGSELTNKDLKYLREGYVSSSLFMSVYSAYVREIVRPETKKASKTGTFALNKTLTDFFTDAVPPKIREATGVVTWEVKPVFNGFIKDAMNRNIHKEFEEVKYTEKGDNIYMSPTYKFIVDILRKYAGSKMEKDYPDFESKELILREREIKEMDRLLNENDGFPLLLRRLGDFATDKARTRIADWEAYVRDGLGDYKINDVTLSALAKLSAASALRLTLYTFKRNVEVKNKPVKNNKVKLYQVLYNSGNAPSSIRSADELKTLSTHNFVMIISTLFTEDVKDNTEYKDYIKANHDKIEAETQRILTFTKAPKSTTKNETDKIKAEQKKEDAKNHVAQYATGDQKNAKRRYTVNILKKYDEILESKNEKPILSKKATKTKKAKK